LKTPEEQRLLNRVIACLEVIAREAGIDQAALPASEFHPGEFDALWIDVMRTDPAPRFLLQYCERGDVVVLAEGSEKEIIVAALKEIGGSASAGRIEAIVDRVCASSPA
jgi:hypothetical protein